MGFENHEGILTLTSIDCFNNFRWKPAFHPAMHYTSLLSCELETWEMCMEQIYAVLVPLVSFVRVSFKFSKVLKFLLKYHTLYCAWMDGHLYCLSRTGLDLIWILYFNLNKNTNTVNLTAMDNNPSLLKLSFGFFKNYIAALSFSFLFGIVVSLWFIPPR